MGVPSFPPLTDEQEDILEKNMIWIFGSVRSGTTWLGRDLLNHSSTIYWHEPYIGWLLAAIPEWHYGEERYFFSREHMKNLIPTLRKLILARTFSQAQSLSLNIVIKEPNGSKAADIVMSCFPKSKLIFILRDGRDVIDSLIDASQPNSFYKKISVGRLDTITSDDMRYEAIKKHSKNWIKEIETVWKSYENHNPKLRYMIRYEDLKNQTFFELKKLYDFLEIKISDAELKEITEKYHFLKIPESERGPGKFYRIATPGAWKKNFSDEEQVLLNSIMGDTLKKFDYVL